MLVRTAVWTDARRSIGKSQESWVSSWEAGSNDKNCCQFAALNH